MLDALFSNENYQAARQLIDASTLRHQAIASNIANAETPGYKRVDISPDFTAELRRAVEHGELHTSNLKPELTQDATAKSLRADGNNIEIEKELLELARNNTEHGFLTQVVSSNLRSLRVAITGRSG